MSCCAQNVNLDLIKYILCLSVLSVQTAPIGQLGLVGQRRRVPKRPGVLIPGTVLTDRLGFAWQYRRVQKHPEVLDKQVLAPRPAKQV